MNDDTLTAMWKRRGHAAAVERCEQSATGHVFKTDNTEVVRCTCGHTLNLRRCVRCGLPDAEDRGIERAHRQ